jgi:hypothetical protein
MTWRRIAIYYALGIALGGYFFLVEWDPARDKPIPTPSRVVTQSRFLPVSREDVSELELRRDGATVTCRREGERWIVIEPAGAKVASDLITSFVENLTPEREVQIIETAAKDLSLYGLDQPSATVTVKGRNMLATVLLGGPNPTGTAIYARKENSLQVVLLGTSVSYYEDLIFEAAGFKRK